jgi:hypothetical protein
LYVIRSIRLIRLESRRLTRKPPNMDGTQKVIFKFRRTVFLGLLIGVTAISAIANDESPRTDNSNWEQLYTRWHQAIIHSSRTESMFFQKTFTATHFDDLIDQINSHRLAMANFVCEKVISESTQEDKVDSAFQLYVDTHLLEYVCGVNLYYSDNDPANDTFKTVKQCRARFIKDWQSGVFQDPQRARAGNLRSALDSRGRGTP